MAMRVRPAKNTFERRVKDKVKQNNFNKPKCKYCDSFLIYSHSMVNPVDLLKSSVLYCDHASHPKYYKKGIYFPHNYVLVIADKAYTNYRKECYFSNLKEVADHAKELLKINPSFYFQLYDIKTMKTVKTKEFRKSIINATN